MDIIKTLNANALKIEIAGRLDTSTAPALDAEIRDVGEDITDLVLDLGQLDYISSAGLRVVLAAQKKMNKQGKMTVVNVNEDVMEIFEITGFSDILTIE